MCVCVDVSLRKTYCSKGLKAIFYFHFPFLINQMDEAKHLSKLILGEEKAINKYHLHIISLIYVPLRTLWQNHV